VDIYLVSTGAVALFNSCYILFVTKVASPIPGSARSKGWVYGRSLAGIVISKPAGCCVLSGTGLCVGVVTRPEESYRVWCVWVWSYSFENEEALAH